MESTMTHPYAPMTLRPTEIEERPWRPVAGCPGVRAKELLRVDGTVHAMISYEPGATTPGAPHLRADHYIWVVSGEATVAGQPVIRDVGQGGCTILQMHTRIPPG